MFILSFSVGDEGEELKPTPVKTSEEGKPIKKKRGRPKGSMSKDKTIKLDPTKRKTNLAKKVLRSGVSI